eukprot:gb/GEZN01004378.1/.p2 GENE.gb/GEZN01004378.1/~~gb/GEZN01004378.1/.p2  ORF type:complete len:218 (+),score=20.48 gb/GEZN01004378.1/:33-686(+)
MPSDFQALHILWTKALIQVAAWEQISAEQDQLVSILCSLWLRRTEVSGKLGKQGLLKCFGGIEHRMAHKFMLEIEKRLLRLHKTMREAEVVVSAMEQIYEAFFDLVDLSDIPAFLSPSTSSHTIYSTESALSVSRNTTKAVPGPGDQNREIARLQWLDSIQHHLAVQTHTRTVLLANFSYEVPQQGSFADTWRHEWLTSGKQAQHVMSTIRLCAANR